MSEIKVEISAVEYKVAEGDNWAVIRVEPTGYTTLVYWRWEGEHGRSRAFRPSVDGEYMAVVSSVWAWLSDELEIVALKPIGPEDSEYFADTERIAELLAGRVES